jgi:hypothetical protein
MFIYEMLPRIRILCEEPPEQLRAADQHSQKDIEMPGAVTPHASTNNTSRLIPVTKWNEHYEWPPVGGLRHLVFHAKTNGFHTVIRHVGRRVLIDEQAFFDWVNRQNQTGGTQ